MLREKKLSVEITNAGVSGDTTAGTLGRLNWVLGTKTWDWVLLGIGANDGLRRFNLVESEKTLSKIVQELKKRNIRVLLLGMQLPTNFDSQYRKQFEGMYTRVARNEGVPLLPFLLNGVATNPKLNLDDQIHPNAAGAKIVAQNVFQTLLPLLKPAQ